jgi:hypothetical protein
MMSKYYSVHLYASSTEWNPSDEAVSLSSGQGEETYLGSCEAFSNLLSFYDEKLLTSLQSSIFFLGGGGVCDLIYCQIPSTS